jgi:RNA polymerase sigma-70 factor (ECF subfamily)
MKPGVERVPRSASDEQLIAAIANADLDALGQLFERHEPALRRYLGRLGCSASDADDLVQATFLEVMRAAKRFDAQHAAAPWLFGIATMMTRRQRRSLARSAVRVAEWTRLMRREPPPTPAAIAEGDAVERRFAAALERLAPKKREVFVLVTLEGMSGEAVAAALGVPINTVWTRLHHARVELRKALEERER